MIVDPQHADKNQQCGHGKDAVLVIGQVDASLDKKQAEDDVAWHSQVRVEVSVPFHVLEIGYVFILSAELSFQLLQVGCVAHGCGCQHQAEVELVRDEGVDGWESAVDRQEV